MSSRFPGEGWAWSVDDRRVVRLLRAAVIVLLVLGGLAFVARGADRPPDPHFVAAGGNGSVPGFTDVAFRVDRAAGVARCALLADTEEQRAKGLMGRTDLAGRDAMVFRFPTDTSAGFYMRNTPMPLSLGWFDASGRFLGATDMAPCGDRSGCPTYSPPGPYRQAVEVPQGGLGRLGMVAGSRLEVGGPCR